jgi:hypothetical protein
MNKLVIIGNGFDLAHNLPTSYLNFINHFWKSLNDNQENEVIKDMVYINPGYKGFFTSYNNNITCFKDFYESTSIYAKENGLIFISDLNNFTLKHRNNTLIFNFRNDFFKIITLQSVVNWVDIENIYYEILVDLVKGQQPSARHRYLKSIDILNSEFNQVKSLLECRYVFYVIKK